LVPALDDGSSLIRPRVRPTTTSPAPPSSSASLAPLYILPYGEDCKSPAPPLTSEKSRGRIPEKFGSGNGVNARKNSSLKPLFFENTRFNREKTGQYRSVRKCAKTGQPNTCPGIQSPPDDRYGLKIKRSFPAPENRSRFSEKMGDPCTGAASLAPEGSRDLGSTPGLLSGYHPLTTGTSGQGPTLLHTAGGGDNAELLRSR
jgi:hypothetical protein